MAGDAIQILVSESILIAHVARLSGYGVWSEVTHWGGGVAFAYIGAALIGTYGAWRSAGALTNGTWQALRVLTLTVPAVALLWVVLPFLTWSRSGP
jgi:hypothetical protein